MSGKKVPYLRGQTRYLTNRSLPDSRPMETGTPQIAAADSRRRSGRGFCVGARLVGTCKVNCRTQKCCTRICHGRWYTSGHRRAPYMKCCSCADHCKLRMQPSMHKRACVANGDPSASRTDIMRNKSRCPLHQAWRGCLEHTANASTTLLPKHWIGRLDCSILRERANIQD